MRRRDKDIAAAVVLHNPAADDLDRLQASIGGTIEVIVVDNSEPQLEPEQSITWISMGENKGVAAALNTAAARARDEGYDWLLTLDQDTNVPEETLVDYVTQALKLPDLDQVAVFGPNLGDGEPDGQVEETFLVMTSASLINLSIWRTLGGFVEDLFVDEVDHEYCLHAKSHGYSVIRLGNVLVPHKPGETRTVSGGKEVDWHPPQRLYYLARNYWYLKRKYARRFPSVIAGRKRLVLAKYKAHLRYHPNKIRSLWALTRGTIDGFLGNFGR